MKPSALLIGLAVFSNAVFATKKRLIVDTDLLNFDDDPLAVGFVNILQSWGEVELLGVMSCRSHYEWLYWILQDLTHRRLQLANDKAQLFTVGMLLRPSTL